MPHASILVGDCLQRLKQLPDNSVQCCVTSPPYWGLRDYGVDGQLGLEPTPQEFVARMVEVFREVRRVLRPDGVCFVNLGDSYAASPGQRKATDKAGEKQQSKRGSTERPSQSPPGLKPKDLCGIPWRVALALQDDGWWLRQDIIWHKPNPMPESVRDRCTKAHEYLFLLTKSARYYWDADSILEPNADPKRTNFVCGSRSNGENKDRNDNDMAERAARFTANGRNARSVWTITTKPYKGAHFATFPEEIPLRCIRVASRPGDAVLDPFLGSGTTAAVALKLGRDAIGCELNPEYAELARERCCDAAGLFGSVEVS